ncbi:MAG: hypothetical protein IJZ42_12565 [Lachnospiraceae bacterium]|nr:hypothetical protein [Lachnospiraceae bacterium]
MNSEMKMNVSPVTRLGDKRVAYVLFTDKSSSAEFIIPGGELLNNKGFDEKELAEMKEYLDSEQDHLFQVAKELNPMRSFMKD